MFLQVLELTRVLDLREAPDLRDPTLDRTKVQGIREARTKESVDPIKDKEVWEALVIRVLELTQDMVGMGPDLAKAKVWNLIKEVPELELTKEVKDPKELVEVKYLRVPVLELTKDKGLGVLLG